MPFLFVFDISMNPRPHSHRIPAIKRKPRMKERHKRQEKKSKEKLLSSKDKMNKRTQTHMPTQQSNAGKNNQTNLKSTKPKRIENPPKPRPGHPPQRRTSSTPAAADGASAAPATPAAPALAAGSPFLPPHRSPASPRGERAWARRGAVEPSPASVREARPRRRSPRMSHFGWWALGAALDQRPRAPPPPPTPPCGTPG